MDLFVAFSLQTDFLLTKRKQNTFFEEDCKEGFVGVA